MVALLGSICEKAFDDRFSMELCGSVFSYRLPCAPLNSFFAILYGAAFLFNIFDISAEKIRHGANIQTDLSTGQVFIL